MSNDGFLLLLEYKVIVLRKYSLLVTGEYIPFKVQVDAWCLSLSFSIKTQLLSIATLFVSNVFIHFFVTLLNFYFITAVGVGLFYYYNKDFIESRLGQNIEEIV